jgi:dienelactone hydrolase
MIERIRTGIIDLRRLLDWAETRRGVAAGSVAVIGFSESTFQVAGLMASDPRVAAAVFLMGGAHPHEIL